MSLEYIMNKGKVHFPFYIVNALLDYLKSEIMLNSIGSTQ